MQSTAHDFRSNVDHALADPNLQDSLAKLKVGFFECSASWMLYWMERMEFGYDNLKPDYAPYLKLRPSEYVRRNCFLTVESNEACLPEAIEKIGADRLMASSDYPHWDCGWPGCIKELGERMGPNCPLEIGSPNLATKEQSMTNIQRIAERIMPVFRA